LAIACLLMATAFAEQAESEGGPATDALDGCRVKLSWKTETENNAFGYLVYRGTTADTLVCINEEQPLHAVGTTTSPARYRFYDLKVECGAAYFYRVAAVDLNGTEKWIIGEKAPVETKAKPLSDEEQSEIKTNGSSYRYEETPEQTPAPRLSPR